MIYRNTFLISSFFCLVTLIPPFIYVAATAPSMTLPLIAILFILSPFFFYGRLKIPQPRIIIYFLAFCIYAYIISALKGGNISNTIVSILLLFSTFILTKNLACFFLISSDKSISRAIKNIFTVLLFFLILEMAFSFNPLRYKEYHKSIFPFSEASHFSLSIIYFMPVILKKSKKLFKLTLTVVFLFFAIYIQNATLLLGTYLSIFIAYFDYRPLRLALILTPVLIAFLFYKTAIGTYIPNYFLERLFLDQKNLSSLVFIQGWEMIREGILSVFGFGINNLESMPVTNSGEIIKEITGKYFNRNDGSFLAAKIIGETGVLGAIICVMIIRKSYFCLRAKPTSTLGLFLNNIPIMFLVELFIRGTGYFSVGTVLLFVYLHSHKDEYKYNRRKH